MYVYPRLPGSEARALIAEFEGQATAELGEQAAINHPRAHPVPTGGPVVPSRRLQQVRAEALRAAATWTEGIQVPRRDVAEFDRAVGAALHEVMRILPADAAHEETWNFITLVLLPDLAVRRFPERHPSRLLGGHRNAFRRSWWRREVLGDLMTVGDPPLGEDELVGIFERSKMARSRELSRAIARAVLEYEGPDRSGFARLMIKVVRRQTGPRLLDALDRDELERLVRSASQSVDREKNGRVGAADSGSVGQN